MHFWIDKRSQTCGFSGRHRLPPSFIHTTCRQQRRNRRRSPRGGDGKPMVTPVHRFQPIENTGLQSGGSATGANRRGVSSNHHHHHHPQQQHQRQLHNYLPPTYVTNLVHARNNGGHSAELDSSVFLDLPLNGNSDHAQAAAQRDLASTPDVAPAKAVRYGIWAAVAFSTVVAAVIKLFIYDNKDKGTGLEVLGVFGLFVVVLVGACTVTIRRSPTRSWDITTTDAPTAPPSQGPSGSSVGHDHLAVMEDGNRNSPSPAPPGTSQPSYMTGLAEIPPPPYHIAIKLPHQKISPLDNDESPPPSYDKAVG